MTESFTKWDVTEHLRTQEDVRLYLRSMPSFEEDPGDGSLICCRPGTTSPGRETCAKGFTRPCLSEDGNPTFATVMRITRALGMNLRITA